MKKNNINNHCSILLTQNENKIVFQLLGAKNVSIYTTVAQIYETEPPFHSYWNLIATVVLCLVRDSLRKGYFLRGYSFNELLWEHELYVNMDYTRSKIFLHVFEGDQGIIALNFAHAGEADELYGLLQTKISGLTNAHIGKTNKKLTISKKTIGRPTNFKHLQHVGFGPEQGFKLQLTSSEFISFFEKTGLPEDVIRKDSTKRVIQSFIDDYGEEAILQAISDKGIEPPPPPRTSSSKKAQDVSHTPLPQFSHPPPPTPPPLFSHPPPSTPPPQFVSTRDLPKLPANKPTNQKSSSFKSPPPIPLRTPPPLQKFNANYSGNAPKPPPLFDYNVESIAPDTPSVVVPDARSNLLESIRKGKNLKPVSERHLNETSATNENVGNKSNNVVDIRTALQSALLKRSQAIESDEESNDEEESYESDWD